MAGKRRYSSTLRAEQTEAARGRILDVAGRLFVERGYLGTTIAEVAGAAGVSVQTVYNVLGGKAVLLKAVYDRTLAGDDEPVPMVARPLFQAVVEAVEGRACLMAYARAVRVLGERTTPLVVMLLAQAATGDQDHDDGASDHDDGSPDHDDGTADHHNGTADHNQRTRWTGWTRWTERSWWTWRAERSWWTWRSWWTRWAERSGRTGRTLEGPTVLVDLADPAGRTARVDPVGRTVLVGRVTTTVLADPPARVGRRDPAARRVRAGLPVLAARPVAAVAAAQVVTAEPVAQAERPAPGERPGLVVRGLAPATGEQR